MSLEKMDLILEFLNRFLEQSPGLFFKNTTKSSTQLYKNHKVQQPIQLD